MTHSALVWFMKNIDFQAQQKLPHQSAGSCTMQFIPLEVRGTDITAAIYFNSLESGVFILTIGYETKLFLFQFKV